MSKIYLLITTLFVLGADVCSLRIWCLRLCPFLAQCRWILYMNRHFVDVSKMGQATRGGIV